MEIIDKMKQHELWKSFMNYRVSRGDMKKKDCEDLKRFVTEKEYIQWISSLEQTKAMSIPVLIEVNKNGVDRKRQVFSFPREEIYILKMIAYLLKEYDYLFSDNLYSFRSNTGVKKAIGKILGNIDIGNIYTYKADIHDYFNSISTDNVLKMFKEWLPSENWLYTFFENMLKNPYALKDERIIEIKKGVMAGTPTAGFLANLYLKEMDEFFYEKNIPYARYSDDVIVFGDSYDAISFYETTIKSFLFTKGLEINSKKEIRTVPGEKVEYLGFEFTKDQINISDMTEKKIKDKIKRKSRALYRWKNRKNASDERTARAMIRYLNNKFFNNAIKGEITWCRWYFPLITKDDKLKRIDEYAVSTIRYLYTGKYGKSNYNLGYHEIKSMGYRSLVNTFWKYKKGLCKSLNDENYIVRIKGKE